MPTVITKRLNEVTDRIIAGAVQVHRAIGPGLLESAYTACLLFELRRMNLKVRTKQAVPVVYEDVRLDCGYQLDMLVEDLVVVELKAVAQLAAIHEAQMITYLKLTGYPAGLLMNFNVKLLRNGVRRILNPKPSPQFLAAD